MDAAPTSVTPDPLGAGGSSVDGASVDSDPLATSRSGSATPDPLSVSSSIAVVPQTTDNGSIASSSGPTKRRVSVAGFDEDEDSMDTSEAGDVATSRKVASPEPGRKKKKIDPQQQMHSLFEFLRRYKHEDGSEVCEHFIRAPKRRTDPAYYEVVSDPIDMLRIQQKLKTEEYADVGEIRADFQRLIDNAVAFYKEDSEEREAAAEMQNLLNKAMGKINVGEDPLTTLASREESEDLLEMLEDLFAVVIKATDANEPERAIHLAFRLLPSQKRYPEYYEVTAKPMDLKSVAGKIQSGEYESLAELEDDLSTCFRNAMSFNEPGSQIYRDAKTLNKLVKSKRYELEVNKQARENRGSRSTRRSQVKKRFSAEIAGLSYEESESDESEEENADSEDPLWQLYDHVRHFQTASGILLAKPFLNLPSKRDLPAYYDVIDNPISMNEIRKKLKGGEYGELTDLADDFSLMFDNCKKFNRPDTKLHKDGVRLQKAFKSRLTELLTDDEDEEEEDEDEDEENVALKPTGGRSPRDPLKKRLRAMYNAVLHHKNRDGIELVGMFMTKPSRKDYPDYYEVITNPMDMNTINERIKSGHYGAEENFLVDMRLMFKNCRTYNEEGSEIYEDANILERVLVTKAKELGVIQPGRRGRKKSAVVKIYDKMRNLFDTIREYKDPKGRQLSLIFLRLPSRTDFPDYFDVIKNPIDFEIISSKLKQNRYNTMEECLADFVLLFDNACKYNEPDSQIYKDALSLQSLAHKTCRKMAEEDENAVPDVNAAVQEILTSVFIGMYNHQDSEDRCFSDSLAELPEHDVVASQPQQIGMPAPPAAGKVRALTLDMIKQRLDKGLYMRLDLFQRDVFSVLERARRISRSDSQIFEDATELQLQFIKLRDEVCANGDVLQSKALLYTAADLTKAVEAMKAEKRATEQPDDDSEDSNVNKEGNGAASSAVFGQQQYTVGEFVYCSASANQEAKEGSPATATGLPQIFLIENIYTNAQGEQMMYGNQFVRPVETFHVPTRKFLENEAFRTEMRESLPLSRIVGRCCVVPVREYMRLRPEGFEDKDVYVCESRYQSKARAFKKMKAIWSVARPAHVKMVARPAPLEPRRVASVFKERVDKLKEEQEEIDAMVSKLTGAVPPDVQWTTEEARRLAQQHLQQQQAQQVEGGVVSPRTYYEQYTIKGPITLKRGDTVYVRSENGKNLIAQIDTMWMENGVEWFHGPWFVTPTEARESNPEHNPTQFFKMECFLSTISDKNPLLSIVGKCSVLEFADYQTLRSTQYTENDVYICESVYDEVNKRVLKGIPDGGLKAYEHSPQVQTDEVYSFKNPIVPQKEGTPGTAGSILSKPALIPISDLMDTEDSLDAPPSVGSAADGPSSITATPVSTPREKKKGKSRPRCGYQAFSAQVWFKVKADLDPGVGFAEISREVGNQWRSLPDHEKALYEEKAKKVNEENKIQMGEEKKLAEERPHSSLSLQVVRPMNGGKTGQQPPQTQQAETQTVQTSHGPPLAKPVEPIFHTVPPRPQRLLHSEAYIRYIEGLSADSQTMSNWERQLTASKANTRTDEAKLPAHWLADNGEHGTSLDALWALREFMMTDALGVTKIM